MRYLLILSCVTCLGCGGCGGGAPDAPKLAPVKGIILIDGKPVEGLDVAFHPDSSKGTTGPLSSAVTSADGSFTLTTAGSRAGAVIGSHKIVVSCPAFGNVGPVSGDGVGSSASGLSEPTEPVEKPKITGACPVPEKYTSIDSTDLSIDISAEGASDLLFDLK